jgi:hypothetical protein
MAHLMLWPFLYHNVLSTWDAEVNRSEWGSYIKQYSMVLRHYRNLQNNKQHI